MEPQVKQVKSETYNYTTACLNDYSKVKVHELVRSQL